MSVSERAAEFEPGKGQRVFAEFCCCHAVAVLRVPVKTCAGQTLSSQQNRSDRLNNVVCALAVSACGRFW